MADRIHGRQYSGIGGHEDFVAVSGLQLEDRSLVCLPATAGAGDATVSRIVAEHAPEGATVTSPRHQVDVVITEHGIAELRGRTTRERAEALAAIAHPDFRAALQTAAAGLQSRGPAPSARDAGEPVRRPVRLAGGRPDKRPRPRGPRRRHRRASSGSRSW